MSVAVENSTSKGEISVKTCFECGGPVTLAYEKAGRISKESDHLNCWEGYYCPRCQQIWVGLVSKGHARCGLGKERHDALWAKEKILEVA